MNSSEVTEVMKSINIISQGVAWLFPKLMALLPTAVAYLAAMVENRGAGQLGTRFAKSGLFKKWTAVNSANDIPFIGQDNNGRITLRPLSKKR